jgi:hypothetical protein
MNIFLLDLDHTKNAQSYCDKHVSKMILETAQILSSALFMSGVEHDGYKPTHLHHPCTRWARNLCHWVYLRDLGRALGQEFTHRYGKEHKSIGVINRLPIPEMTVARPKYFALAMPPEYHRYKKNRKDKHQLDIDFVQSYREYYKSKQDKFEMRWTKRDVPSWFN